MDNENTVLDNNNLDNERTRLFGNEVSNTNIPPIPGNAKRKDNTDRNIGIAAGVTGVATAGATATAAYAMNNNKGEIESELAEDDIIPEPKENIQPAVESHTETHQHQTDESHNSTEHTHEMQQSAIHQQPVENENEIEVLGVVHDDSSNANIAALNVSGQDVFFIDVDNDLSFDYMAVDADNSGDFSDDEIVDITAENISVADLGGFTNGASSDDGPNYADNTVVEEPQSYAYESDPVVNNNFDNGFDESNTPGISSDIDTEFGDLV